MVGEQLNEKVDDEPLHLAEVTHLEGGGVLVITTRRETRDDVRDGGTRTRSGC